MYNDYVQGYRYHNFNVIQTLTFFLSGMTQTHSQEDRLLHWVASA